MFDVLGQIKDLIKHSSVRIDNKVFTLHYRLTTFILIIFVVVIGSRKYFGDPIDCTQSGKGIEQIVDNFCWFNVYVLVPKGTWPADDTYHRYRPVINLEIKSFEELNRPDAKLTAYFLHTYQWIEFIILIQASLFFLPRYLWRFCWEQGKVRSLAEYFKCASLKQEVDEETHKLVVNFLRKDNYDKYAYATKYVACEVLNFINVVAQFVILKTVLALHVYELFDDFFTSKSIIHPEHPMNIVFPNMARCEIPLPSGGGSTNLVEYCVLPVNVFTKKFYIFLWFYFLVLSVITALALIFRLGTILIPSFRGFLLRREGHMSMDEIRVMASLSFPEWFMLSLVGKNIDAKSFSHLLTTYKQGLTPRTSSVPLGDKIYPTISMGMDIEKEK